MPFVYECGVVSQAGIIEEMLEDTMESVMDDPEDMEEEAQEEIDKVRTNNFLYFMM